MANTDLPKPQLPEENKPLDSSHPEENQLQLTIESSKDITKNTFLNSNDVKLITSPATRETVKLFMSMVLAGSLWLTLIVLIGFNYWSVNQLTQKLAALKGDDKDSYIKDAIAANNDTAKGLYTFLTPLAAGITSYYFNLVNSSENKNNQKENE